VRVDVDHVIGAIVEVLIDAGAVLIGVGRIAESPVHREVDDRGPAGLAMIRGVVNVAGREEGVSRGRLSVGVGGIFKGRLGRGDVAIDGSAPVVILALSPSVEGRGDRGDAMVPGFFGAGADFAIHEEVRVAAFLGELLEGADIELVEGEAADLLHGVDPESIDAHADELAIATEQILRHHRVLGVEVDAIAGDLGHLFAPGLPAEVAIMVIVIVDVVIDAIGILHHGKTRVILLAPAKEL
jgi:hypothetical protein